MVENFCIVKTGRDGVLPHGAVFKFITPENKEVSPYFVSIGPFAHGPIGQNELLRAFELREEDGHLITTRTNTVILPGVRVKVYPELIGY